MMKNGKRIWQDFFCSGEIYVDCNEYYDEDARSCPKSAFVQFTEEFSWEDDTVNTTVEGFMMI